LYAAAGRRPSVAPDQDGGLVMLCVRVPPSLRRRVRLAAVANGLTMQQLAVEALEDVCRQHDA
jgi:predicted HicB family RNase H-like nuclease